MCAISRAQNLEAGSSTRIEMIRAFFKGEDTPSTPADYVASAKHRDEKELDGDTERTVAVLLATLRVTIEGIPGLIEETVTAMVTTEGNNGVKRTDK